MTILACVSLLLWQSPAVAPASPAPDAAAIMAAMAANVEKAVESRRQYVYQQTVRSSLIRSNGNIGRREKRVYSAVPSESGTAKKLESFSGEYSRGGKQLLPYTEPGFRYKGMDIDGDLIESLTEDLVNEKGSRDGIPHSLFPLRTRDLGAYDFQLKGETQWKGRRTYQVTFEPAGKPHCVALPDGDDGCEGAWRGEAWVDAEDLQPVRIDTHLAVHIPWAVRAFLGVNLQQTGFSITYQRLEPGVWFPSTYGTEFKLKVLFGYKRTIALAMESMDFRKTSSDSLITYQPPAP